jgi:hypothetical protein
MITYCGGRTVRVRGGEGIARVAGLCNYDYMNTAKHDVQGDLPDKVRGWFIGRLPDGWFAGTPEILVDREEITIIGQLPAVTEAGAEAGAASEEGGTEGASETEAEAIAIGRSRRFREETRDSRISIAREAEMTFGRKVSWGVVCEGRKVMFTTLSVPVMTRLRQSERRVLDTLVDAGVARSRSDALAWCVRLVGQHEDSWLADLRSALRWVGEVRAEGPRA